MSRTGMNVTAVEKLLEIGSRFHLAKQREFARFFSDNRDKFAFDESLVGSNWGIVTAEVVDAMVLAFEKK